MEDDLGIVFLVENAQQFWSELDDALHIPNEATTLSHLDFSLKRFLDLCATYHEQYLQSPLQLEHACDLLLDSELFAFHSGRMCEILMDDAQLNTNPHTQLILYNVLLSCGRRNTNFFRSRSRWQPLFPLLMDHILVEIDPDIQATYSGLGSNTISIDGGSTSVPVPIEAKLRSLSVRLLYEVCRVQKLTMQDLRIFDDSFLDYLFDLVEQTRNMQDETFNYSVIKLIVALNEQFMVASLNSAPTHEWEPQSNSAKALGSQNRVLQVLMRRLGSSQTFGENMIFMLNRAKRTAEDLCMQLLVLKILYLLFTTKGTSEYFYTNDLCVLVDVFLRELVDLDEDSDSLRHTYLRVLHPLLTKTQLRSVPYKRSQIVMALESLIQNAKIRDINPTTKRLVQRCLGGEWCVQLRTAKEKKRSEVNERVGSPGSEIVTSAAQAQSHIFSSAEPSMSTALNIKRSASIGKSRTLKTSKSMEFNKGGSQKEKYPSRSPIERLRCPSNASSFDLVTATAPPSPSSASPTKRRAKAGNLAPPDDVFGISADRYQAQLMHTEYSPVSAGSSPSPPIPCQSEIAPSTMQSTHRRPAPPTPQKRRKPPAIPLGRAANDDGTTTTTMTAIKSSATSAPPLSAKSPSLQQSFVSSLHSGYY